MHSIWREQLPGNSVGNLHIPALDFPTKISESSAIQSRPIYSFLGEMMDWNIPLMSEQEVWTGFRDKWATDSISADST